jgi:hypothetical protein
MAIVASFCTYWLVLAGVYEAYHAVYSASEDTADSKKDVLLRR